MSVRLLSRARAPPQHRSIRPLSPSSLRIASKTGTPIHSFKTLQKAVRPHFTVRRIGLLTSEMSPLRPGFVLVELTHSTVPSLSLLCMHRITKTRVLGHVVRKSRILGMCVLSVSRAVAILMNRYWVQPLSRGHSDEFVCVQISE